MGRSTANLTGKRCQCTACGEVFSTEAKFDRHRRGKYQEKRYCLEPEQCGLILAPTQSGTVWRMPGRFDD